MTSPSACHFHLHQTEAFWSFILVDNGLLWDNLFQHTLFQENEHQLRCNCCPVKGQLLPFPWAPLTCRPSYPWGWHTWEELTKEEFMLELPALKCWEHTCVTGPDSKESEGVKRTQFYGWVGGQALQSLETWHCLLSQICSCSAHQPWGLYGLQESVSRAVRPSSQNDRYWWV